MRFLTAFILLTLVSATPSFALFNYSCSADVGGSTCKCSGVADCRQMRLDKVCTADSRYCTPNNVCSCDWNQRTAPNGKPTIFKRPGSLFAD